MIKQLRNTGLLLIPLYCDMSST